MHKHPCVIEKVIFIFFNILISIAVNSHPQQSLSDFNFNKKIHSSYNAQALSTTGGGSLRFTDTTYIDLGDAPELRLTNFTLEAWVKIEGYGSTTETGNGGLTAVVPVITKGREEAETALKDVNYFLGYDVATNKLVADFEDAASVNHPVTSNATIAMNTWTHIGASFDVATQTWRLFIGTSIETFVLAGSFIPQSASSVSACIGSTLNDANLPIRSGSFNGRIDEVRIWNIALTSLDPGELLSSIGLVGRWGLGDGAGTTALNSVSGGVSGIIVNNFEWVTGFNEPDPTTNASIDFNGEHDYVTFGPAPSLNTTAASTGFTLEALIKIEGVGISTTTGIGGLAATVPIIAKGADENEFPDNTNMNYFLGINSANFLVADFEEAAGANTGLNHPVTGNTAIAANAWTHVAVTYNISDGAWNLYVNGNLAGTGNAGAGVVPEYASGQFASVATTLTSGGLPSGFFNGKIDEVLIWNRALNESELQPNSCASLSGAKGLLGHWNFNENGDLTAANSVAGGVNGLLISNNISTHPTNGGPAWVCNTAGEYRSKNVTGTWSAASDWETLNGATWSTAIVPPGKTDNVTISTGTQYTLSGPVSCNDLTVNSGGKLLRNAGVNTYITLYGNIVCDGSIGNGSVFDGISFNVEGDICSISGSGAFDCSRIKKSCNGHTTTTLTFNRDVNLRYNGTALFNDASSSFFNIIIAPGVTVNCLGDGTFNSSGSVAIDGTNGADFGYNAGSLTVDGTLNLAGSGTAMSTMYVTTNNANILWPVSITISQTGTINTGTINCNASGAASHSLLILSGGKLNITGEPATYIAPSLVNNNYTFQPGSTMEYSAQGDQTVYTFGSINYSNLFSSGSGTKTILAPLGVTDTIRVTDMATLSSGGNLTLLSSATKTASVAELPVDGSGIPLANITGDVIVERYISARRAWRFLAVPTNTVQTIKAAWQEGATLSGSDPVPGFGTQVTNHVVPTPLNGFDYDSPAGPSVKKYDVTATGVYAPFISINTAFDPIATKEGLMAFIRGDRTAIGLGATSTPTVLRTSGPLFTGTQAPIIVAADQFASIGNPYASPVDMRKISKTTGVNDNYYLWDPKLTSGSFGGYQTFSLMGTEYVPTPGGGSYPPQGPGPLVTPYNYIQSGMAFFKEANGNTGGTLTFTESAKANPSALIGAAAFRPDHSLIPHAVMRTNLYAVEADKTINLIDGVLNDFGDYTNKADKLDAVKLQNFAENLALKTDGRLLAVERRHAITKDDTLQLYMLNMKIKSYRLKIFGENFSKPGIVAILKDSFLNTATAIDVNGSTTYDFDITHAPGSWNTGRFSIVFNNLLRLPLIFNSVRAFRLSENIAVEWKVENEVNIKQYEVERSADAQHFIKASMITSVYNSGGTVNYRWLDQKPETAIHYYRIRSVAVDSEIKYSNIAQVVSETTSQISVSTGPIPAGVIRLQFLNKPPGNYKIRLLNSLGQVLATEVIQHREGEECTNLQTNINTLAHAIYQLEITNAEYSKVIIRLLH